MNFQPMPANKLQWQLYIIVNTMLALEYSVLDIEKALSNINSIINEDAFENNILLRTLYREYRIFESIYKAYKNNMEQQNLKAAMQMKYREDVHIMEFVREQQNARSLDEAKEIQRDLIRGEREELWNNADIEFTKAQESGNTEDISAASTYRQKLRDAPASTMISEATTVDQLIPITLDKILES